MDRTVTQTVTGTATQDGAGVRLVRVLGSETARAFDPFLMLDAFDSRDPDDYVRGFPWHPHRGIETVTYLISGLIEHEDSLGNKGAIRDGDCQWMTAGSGILHQEMPRPSERMLGLQLWLNLPAADKMCAPRYHDIVAGAVPRVELPGCTVRVIAGSYQGRPGAAQGEHVGMTMLDLALDPGARFTMDTPPEQTVFTYQFRGEGSLGAGGGRIRERHAALWGPGDRLDIQAGGGGLRLVLCMGRPLGEPIAWGGPIVMNTREELRLAFDELDQGRFIKHRI